MDDSDWIRGTFSTPGVGSMSVGLSGVTHYEFLQDGTLFVGGVQDCADNIEIEPERYTWERKGEDVVEVDLPDDGSGVDAWRFEPSDACEWTLMYSLRDGEPVNDGTSLTRGAVCLRETGPCAEGTSCETCETVWCEGESPPCGE